MRAEITHETILQNQTIIAPQTVTSNGRSAHLLPYTRIGNRLR